MERKNHFKVAVDVVVNEWNLPYEGTEDIKVVSNEVIHVDKISQIVHYTLIVQMSNRYYSAYHFYDFNTKTTEWCRKDFVDFFEVFPVEKTINVFLSQKALKYI